MFLFLLFLFFVCHLACAQEMHSCGEDLCIPDSIEINREIVGNIDFSVNLGNLMQSSKDNYRFLGAESLPDVYIGKSRDLRISLAPYNGSTRYYEDPVKGMGKMMSDSFGKKFSTEVNLNLPYTRGSFHNVRTGGVGFSFSLEDALLFIFSKSHRAKVRNSKNAVAWKYY